MSYNVFLDDVRSPKDGFLYNVGKMLCVHTGIPDFKWDVVRNYEDFVELLENKGMPDVVSFDCDLSMEHMRHFVNVTQHTGVYEWENFQNKCGVHCAMYMKDKIKKSGNRPIIYIHSANHVGREIIAEILKDYI